VRVDNIVGTPLRKAPDKPRLTRILLLLTACVGLWAFGSSLFVVDATEFAVVTRFGRVVRVIDKPGLYATWCFDQVRRPENRLLLSTPPAAEYLSTDKKNVVLQSLIAWRVVDPAKFLTSLETRARAEERLGDVTLAETGAVLARRPFSALVFVDPDYGGQKEGRDVLIPEIRRSVAAIALDAYGIEVAYIGLRHLSLPEQNRRSVFERMKAERGKIAKQYRSEGELEAKAIIARADREKVRIDAEAYADARRLRADGDAEAARIYANAFTRNPVFYRFQRTLQAYERILDESTTMILSADTEALLAWQDENRMKVAPERPRGPGPRSPVPTSEPSASGDGLSARLDPANRALAPLDILLGNSAIRGGER
jgi:modulator of FtsH protease HflC